MDPLEKEIPFQKDHDFQIQFRGEGSILGCQPLAVSWRSQPHPIFSFQGSAPARCGGATVTGTAAQQLYPWFEGHGSIWLSISPFFRDRSWKFKKKNQMFFFFFFLPCFISWNTCLFLYMYICNDLCVEPPYFHFVPVIFSHNWMKSEITEYKHG